MLSKSVVVAAPEARERLRLGRLVEQIPEFSLVAEAACLMETYNEVETKLPKAVLIADVLAEQPEFEVMRGLFSALDIRWLVVASRNRSAQVVLPGAGGADLFALPAEADGDTIARQLRGLTQSAPAPIPPVKPPPERPRRDPPGGRRPPPALPCGQDRPGEPPRAAAPRAKRLAPDRVILIGSSTGGVDALLTLLSRFPADCPPVLVVQHTGAGFGESLAGLLDRQCQARAVLASGSAPLAPGVITLGAGLGAHLVIEDGARPALGLRRSPPVSGHLPSVDMLFRSALGLGPRVSAALLTGMGRDGAEGLAALRAAGAHTIAQDEASSVVYGMPRAAAEIGAAREILPLAQIGTALLRPARIAPPEGGG